METIQLQKQQQWRDQQEESDQDQLERAAKAPKLLFEEKERSSPPPDLALYTHEPESYNHKATSAIATSLSPGRFFSLAQWQELELQALIYKYMVAGVPVPYELILPIKRSLLNAYHHSQQYLHFQSAMLHASYWGRYAMDPEPDRCRRTDGKKWRCSKEVVVGHKYCERHMHRGRNRSRKLVEVAAAPTTSAAASGAGGSKSTAVTPLPLNPSKDSRFSLAALQPPLTAPHLNSYNRSPYGEAAAEWYVSKSYHHPIFSQEGLPDDKSSGGGRVLRPFFDDWPRSSDREPPNSSTPSPVASPSQLSISIPGGDHHHSDFSLKLSTGSSHKAGVDKLALQQQGLPGNWSGWDESFGAEASMGGPLAEALRSSTTSNPSPTTVLLKPMSSISNPNSIST